MKKNKQLVLYGILFFSLFFLDRITKWAMLQWGNTEIKIAPFLSFVLSFNRGVSWGMFHSEKTGPFIFVTLLTAAIIIPLIWYTIMRWRRGFFVWKETIVIAGAISNFIDRIFYGGVVDFISFSYGSWSWPAFNIADSCIVVGVSLILIGFFKEG